MLQLGGDLLELHNDVHQSRGIFSGQIFGELRGVGKGQTDGHTRLRPTGPEATSPVITVLHGQKYGATPFTTHTGTLQEA